MQSYPAKKRYDTMRHNRRPLRHQNWIYKKCDYVFDHKNHGYFDTPGNLIDIDANLLQLGGLRPDVAGVHVDDIPVNQHFPGIGGKVLRVELGHFLLDQGPFFRRHRDAQHNVSCSVCHSFTVLSEQGFGVFPNKQPATARRGRGGPVFGSVATLV